MIVDDSIFDIPQPTTHTYLPAKPSTPSSPAWRVSLYSAMKTLRLAIIGLGNMGRAHCKTILDGKVPGCELAAVCDLDPDAFADYPDIPHFTSTDELIASGTVDAVLVATPHYDHTSIGIAALEAGLHVLVEKPISVHKADCERLVAAHRGGKKQIFAAMFNQRTDPAYQKVRELVRNGELGKIQRVNWIITDWSRSESYYASGGWRATWAGEGGGVLLNQCPHNLDLYQWIFGMPSKVRGFCQFGRYHQIEVEDDVTAYFEYPDGHTGVFITSTGEAPGTNRLEITGDQGRLVLEDGKLAYRRNETATSKFTRTSKSGFAQPPLWNVDIPLPDHRGAQHLGILKNFTNSILSGEKLIAPAAEGIHSVELANSILLSSLTGETIDVPLDGARFAQALEKLIATSKPKKKISKGRKAATDFSKSF